MCSICPEMFYEEFTGAICDPAFIQAYCIYVPHTCPANSETEPTEAETEPTEALYIEVWRCASCTYTCSDLQELSQHQCNDELPYKCNLCSMAFRRAFHLRQHGRSHVPKVQLFHCNQCSATRRSELKMLAHMQVHAGKKAFRCRQCNAAFTNRHMLSTHVLTHTGEQPYNCQCCPRSFPTAAALADHSEHCSIGATST